VFARGLSTSSVLPERLVVLLRESRWLLQCCIAIFFALILLSYNSADPGWSHAVSAREIRNLGVASEPIFQISCSIFSG